MISGQCRGSIRLKNRPDNRSKASVQRRRATEEKRRNGKIFALPLYSSVVRFEFSFVWAKRPLKKGVDV